MAQYEQKTDSREFEVANPEQHPGMWGVDLAGDATDIAIRLWGVERPDRAAPLTWKAESVVVYMITDLVGASHGRIAEESTAMMAAHFENSRQALVAAKRIQTLILEFLACRPGQRIAGALLMYRPRTADPTGFSGEMAQQTLGRAKPGQILLVESVSRRLRDLPGTEFVAVPAVTGDVETGLTELEWTTADQVARLRESVVDEPEPRRDDSPAVGATLIVDSPFARRGMNEAVPPPLPLESAGDFGIKDGADAWHRTEQVPNTAQHRTLSSEDFHESAGGSLLEGIEFEERPLFTRTRILLGVVALVLVGAVIAVLYRPTTATKRPIPPVQTQTGAAESTDHATPPATGSAAGTASGTAAGTAGEAETKKPEEPATVVPPPVKKRVVASPPRTPQKPADSQAKNKQPVEAAPEADTSVSEFGGLSQKDIPRLLDLAKKDAGDGNYEKARREYQAILKLQANNPDAKEGLRKLSIIQGDKDQ